MGESSRRGEIERLLAAIRGGDQKAKGELFALVSDELKRMAGNLMRREREGHTLQPTALVHEAYLRVFVKAPLPVIDRAYFFATQARAMRQILIDHARKRAAGKRPDARDRVPFDGVLQALESSLRFSVFDLAEAMDTLKALSPRQHEVVTLRFFGGLKWSEIAEALEVSVSSCEEDWQVARAWLHRQLKGTP
ncbi:MAG: ECF-type sigma factor [Deltaproteobacteria bacterium]|nr:ECF-type sigma factor [Deltaproteobacteria bacterium]